MKSVVRDTDVAITSWDWNEERNILSKKRPLVDRFNEKTQNKRRGKISALQALLENYDGRSGHWFCLIMTLRTIS